MKLPDEIVVRVHPAKGVSGVFVAVVENPPGHLVRTILATQGESVADAVHSASSALRLLTGECRPPTGAHCFCEHGKMDDGRIALICCHCKTKRPASVAPMAAGVQVFPQDSSGKSAVNAGGSAPSPTVSPQAGTSNKNTPEEEIAALRAALEDTADSLEEVLDDEAEDYLEKRDKAVVILFAARSSLGQLPDEKVEKDEGGAG